MGEILKEFQKHENKNIFKNRRSKFVNLKFYTRERLLNISAQLKCILIGTYFSYWTKTNTTTTTPYNNTVLMVSADPYLHL